MKLLSSLNLPMYIDPTFDEICELAESHWDTIRILVSEDLDCLILASGYGFTHSTLVQVCKEYFKVKRFYTEKDAIIWTENGRAFLGECGDDDSIKHRFDDHLFTNEQAQLLRDLVRESGYSL